MRLFYEEGVDEALCEAIADVVSVAKDALEAGFPHLGTKEVRVRVAGAPPWQGNVATDRRGTIYIQGWPLDDSRLTPEDQVLWGPVFTAIYDQGQCRTAQEYRDLVTKAGFEDFELDADRIITARKPVH